MSSSLIHLAVTQKIIKEFEFKDIDRLRLGCVLPDGAIEGNSHLKKQKENGEYYYDLDKYRALFGELMKTDDLYLGYYLHLIEDIIFRNFMYIQKQWSSKKRENVDQLHHDYEVLNSYLNKHYQFDFELKKIENFNQEKLNCIAKFDLENFCDEVNQQMKSELTGEYYFFTPDLANELIEQSFDFCKEELNHLKQGKEGLDCLKWSWHI